MSNGFGGLGSLDFRSSLLGPGNRLIQFTAGSDRAFVQLARALQVLGSIQGGRFGAGEIGHVTVDPDGVPCRCGRRGCLETVASSRAMVEAAQRSIAEAPDSALGRLAAESGGTVTIDILARALAAGDEHALRIVDHASRQLGRSIAGLIGMLDVHRIALIGAATALGTPWLEQVQAEAARSALSLQTRRSVVEIGRVDPARAVVLGACAVLLTRELGLIPTR